LRFDLRLRPEITTISQQSQISNQESEMRISAVIITFNEAENIRAACESVAWADEILIVDSESTDATRDIAVECGARVINRPWPGFAAQKQFATDSAANDWVFSLDADERVSEQLKESIHHVRGIDPAQLAAGYRMARRTFYMGRWIKGGGWYPDYQLRLFDRTRARWRDRLIHESVAIDDGARAQILPGDLLHLTTGDAAYHHRMIGERYAPLGARQMLNEGKRTSPLRIALAGPAGFLRSFFLKGGFRDGFAGFTIARFAAHHDFLKHSLLWQLQRGAKEK
jgi:glycosyltransferase involved in cell wall biosynthesis